MLKTFELIPGVTLQCFPDRRFKQGCLSVQFLRPMCRQEAALNALLPSVLLRGTERCPDLRAITVRLDDLYGASVGALVRRVGDYQTTGLYCSFMEDRFAMEGDRILQPLVDFLGELLFRPVLENGVFRADFVESEKRNLILTLESQRNDKRVYANARMFELMCKDDSYGISRLGEKAQVETIDPAGLYGHYQRILRESPVNLFYVGATEPRQVAALLRPLFQTAAGARITLPAQTGFRGEGTCRHTERMEVAQGKLCMGFVTPVTLRDREFAAMQVCNMLFGGGMTGKLFMQVREAQSLCYDIGSAYYGSKGILSVSAGIDFDREEQVIKEVLTQLEACARGDFTDEELLSAKQGLISQLQGIHDSPGAIENYYSTGLLSGQERSPAQYLAQVDAVTAEQAAAAAKTLRLHTVYFLKGVR